MVYSRLLNGLPRELDLFKLDSRSCTFGVDSLPLSSAPSFWIRFGFGNSRNEDFRFGAMTQTVSRSILDGSRMKNGRVVD